MFSLGGRWGSGGRDTLPKQPQTPYQSWPTQDTNSMDEEYSLLSKDTRGMPQYTSG